LIAVEAADVDEALGEAQVARADDAMLDPMIRT
jgi:hypothetical protein